MENSSTEVIAKISTPGIYPDISSHEYHHTEICDAPSISSTGLRRITDCPIKYWWHSPLNPNRPTEEKNQALDIGKAAHDLILDGTGWPDRYHVLPEGFSRAATKKFADAIAEADAAENEGKTILKHADNIAVMAMAEAISKHPIRQILTEGKSESTIVWKDQETGVWLRCRPDFLPNNPVVIPDYKTTASASPKDFQRSIYQYGYHQQAALYLDGLAAVLGEKADSNGIMVDRSWFFIAQEKEPPYVIQPYELDEEDVELGRKLNRKAIRLFAKCLETNFWPGYSEDFVKLSLPQWARKEIEYTLLGV